LLQQEFESFSQYVVTKIEILELQSEYNWLVSEDYIRELLKPEYKKTKRAILEISGKNICCSIILLLKIRLWKYLFLTSSHEYLILN
jgi:hypothetical protein